MSDKANVIITAQQLLEYETVFDNAIMEALTSRLSVEIHMNPYEETIETGTEKIYTIMISYLEDITTYKDVRQMIADKLQVDVEDVIWKRKPQYGYADDQCVSEYSRYDCALMPVNYHHNFVFPPASYFHNDRNRYALSSVKQLRQDLFKAPGLTCTHQEHPVFHRRWPAPILFAMNNILPTVFLHVDYSVCGPDLCIRQKRLETTYEPDGYHQLVSRFSTLPHDWDDVYVLNRSQMEHPSFLTVVSREPKLITVKTLTPIYIANRKLFEWKRTLVKNQLVAKNTNKNQVPT